MPCSVSEYNEDGVRCMSSSHSTAVTSPLTPVRSGGHDVLLRHEIQFWYPSRYLPGVVRIFPGTSWLPHVTRIVPASTHSSPRLCSPLNFCAVVFLPYIPLSLSLSIYSPVVITWFLHRWIRLLYSTSSETPITLHFVLKREPLPCPHRHCISSFWCSSSASFSQSFLLFCIVFGFFLQLRIFSLYWETSLATPRVCAVIVLEKPIFILHGVYGVVPAAVRIRKKASKFLYRLWLLLYLLPCAVLHLQVLKQTGVRCILTC